MATKRCPTKEDQLKEEEKRTIEKKQELLKCLQNQVDEVDRNVTDLAKSFDSLYDQLCNRMKESKRGVAAPDKDEDDEDKPNILKEQESIPQLIQVAKGVAEDKEKAIWSLRKLIHFIHADTDDICTDQALGRCKELAIDRYLKNDCPSSDKNVETLIELLEEQNKRLQEKYKLVREHVKIVSEREKIVNDDRNLLRDQLKNLKPRIENRSSNSSMNSGCVATNPDNDTTLKKDGDNIDPDEVGCKNELLEAKQTITRLEAELQSVKTAKDKIEGLSHELVCSDVIEVALVHTRDAVHNSPEIYLENLLTTAMYNSKIKYDLKVVRRTDVTKHNGISLICCVASTRKGWDDMFEKEQFKSIDYESTILLLFYECTHGREFCEKAQDRHCHFLGQFVSTLSIPYRNAGMLQNKDITVKDIMKALSLVKNVVYKRKVVGCMHCKNPSSKTQKSK